MGKTYNILYHYCCGIKGIKHSVSCSYGKIIQFVVVMALTLDYFPETE